MHISFDFVNPVITFYARKGNHLVRISGMIIAKAAMCCETPRNLQRGQSCKFSNGRIPQNNETFIELDTKDAVARATDLIESMDSIDHRIL